MKNSLLLVGAAAAVAVSACPPQARDRYAERPPVVVSPDLSAPWVMQLSRKPGTLAGAPAGVSAYQMQPLLRVSRGDAAARRDPDRGGAADVHQARDAAAARPEIPAAAGRL